jgi:hypothetical protein
LRTANPNVLLQQMFKTQLSQRVPVPQFSGVLDATILDTDSTNPVINPAGQCRIIVPQYAENIAFGPVSYPGVLAPPDGIECVVSFIVPQVNAATDASNVRVLSIFGWPPSGGSDDFVFFLAG